MAVFAHLRPGIMTIGVRTGSGIIDCGRRRQGRALLAFALCLAASACGDKSDSNATVRLTGEGFTSQPELLSGQISAGGTQTCLIRSAALFCWGSNNAGQLGIGLSGSATATETTITVADSHLAARRLGGNIMWSSVSAGFTHTCGISTSQELFCWGSNRNGQIAYVAPTATDTTGTNGGASTGTPGNTGNTGDTGNTDNTGSRFITQGSGVVKALLTRAAPATMPTTDTTTTTTTTTQLAESVPQRVSTTSDWAQVSAGRLDHSCAVKTNGTLHCWGARNFGQLGIGAIGDDMSSGGMTTGTMTDATSMIVGSGYATPRQVGTDSDWRSVSCGLAHTCAIKNDRSLWCWGLTPVGQAIAGTVLLSAASTAEDTALIFGPGSRALLPQRIGTGSDWDSIYLGDYHSCGTRGGQLWCWGSAEQGQLGIGSPASFVDPNTMQPAGQGVQGTASYFAESPVRIGNDSDWSSVGGGRSYSCGIKAGDQLWCWGKLRDVATEVGSLVPLRLGLERDWKFVSTGDHHVCAVSSNNNLFCWGGNSFGAVGDGTNEDKQVPTHIDTSNLK